MVHEEGVHDVVHLHVALASFALLCVLGGYNIRYNIWITLTDAALILSTALLQLNIVYSYYNSLYACMYVRQSSQVWCSRELLFTHSQDTQHACPSKTHPRMRKIFPGGLHDVLESSPSILTIAPPGGHHGRPVEVVDSKHVSTPFRHHGKSHIIGSAAYTRTRTRVHYYFYHRKPSVCHIRTKCAEVGMYHLKLKSINPILNTCQGGGNSAH